MAKRKSIDSKATEQKQSNPASAENLQNDMKHRAAVGQGAQKLEQWFAKTIEDASKQMPELQSASLKPPEFKKISSEMISRFGFKNADDIRIFLLSPAGRSVKKRVANQINLQQNIKEAERIRKQDEAIRKSRFLAFLLLLFADKKKARARSLNEYVQKLIDKQLHHDTSETTSPKTDKNAMNDAFKEYQLAENALNNKLKTQDDLIAKLDEKLQSLEQQSIQEEAKYQALTETAEKSQQDITDIFGQYADNVDSLLVPEDQMDDAVLKDKQAILNQIDSNIALVQQENDDILKQLENDPELIERDPEILTKMQSLNVKVAGLEDVKSVVSGKKMLCDHESKATKSIADSRFIIPKNLQIGVLDGKKHLFSKEQKIAKDEHGKHCLLEPGQDLSEMDAEEKAKAEQKLIKAHEQFNQKQPEMSSISNLVSNNRELVQGFIAEQITKNSQEKESALQDRNNTKAELQQLSQRKQAILAYELSRPEEQLQQKDQASHNQQVVNQAGASFQKDAPKPSPSLETSKKEINPKDVRQRFVTLLKTMRNHPNPSAMDNLKDALGEAAKQNPELSRALKDFRGNPEILKGDSFRLIVELTKNMKAEHMQPIITKLEKMSPNNAKEAAPEKEATPEKEAASTPFNMTPLPTKFRSR